MGKVTINKAKLQVAEEMHPSEEQGTLVFSKRPHDTEKEDAPAEGNKKDATARQSRP